MTAPAAINTSAVSWGQAGTKKVMTPKLAIVAELSTPITTKRLCVFAAFFSFLAKLSGGNSCRRAFNEINEQCVQDGEKAVMSCQLFGWLHDAHDRSCRTSLYTRSDDENILTYAPMNIVECFPFFWHGIRVSSADKDYFVDAPEQTAARGVICEVKAGTKTSRVCMRASWHCSPFSTT